MFHRQKWWQFPIHLRQSDSFTRQLLITEFDGLSVTDDRIRFFLYERVYCHLCHDMEEALALLLKEVGGGREFVIEAIDVDAEESLEQRFGERVPVLVADGRELCHYFLDATAVRAYLAEIR